jgi:hypothetical protein
MTISSTNRKAGPYTGNGTATVFSFAFKVFAAADVEVVRLNVSTSVETVLALTTDYTVTLNQDQNANPGGNVTLVAGALATGFNLVITSDVENLQPTDLTNQGGFYPDVINAALDRATIQIQQLQLGVDRSAKLPITSSTDADALVADIVRLADSADNIDEVANDLTNIDLVANDLTNIDIVANNINNVNTVAGISSNVTTVAGISSNVTSVAGNSTNINTVASNNTNINTVATNISSVTTNATNITAITTNATNITAIQNAASNAASAASSASTATTQATNAANSAALAAAYAASGLYSSVIDKSANYTVVIGDAGALIRASTTSGAITITLPQISTVPDGFKVAVVKWTGDSNAVTVSRSGSDTINGATSVSISAQYSSTTFVADLESAQWFASSSGVGATNVNVQSFSGNGSTVAFTMSSDAGNENNTQVFVSGIYQEKDTYSLSGTTLTFSTAPPTGTSNIEVVWSTPLAIGTPSDGTVTTAKIVDANVTAAKLASGAAISNIGYTPANDSLVMHLAGAETATGAKRGAVVSLTDGANIATDLALGNNFSVTLAGNRTLDNPTNLVAGQSGVIKITQDGTGSRTLAYGSYWDFAGGTAPTLTTTANAVDILAYYVDSSTNITTRFIGDRR